MNLQHIAFKVFVDGELQTDWEEFINVFHKWVAAQSMPEMMVDVADYRHVPNGPGVVMTGHEADYYMDNTGGQPGLRYVCKTETDGTNAERLQEAYRNAAFAAARLESSLPGLTFSRTHFEVTINDRACAPNTPATREELGQLLPGLVEKALGNEAEIELQQDARKLSGATVQLKAPVEFPIAS